jgi:biotin carboxylase
MDFVLDESGEYYFLEMNPNGQWAWIEEKTGADLFGALVNVLCEERL